MIRKIFFFLIIGLIVCYPYICFSSPSKEESNIKLPHQPTVISLLGRVYIEKHGNKERLIMVTKNGEGYYFEGGIINELKKQLLQLGENNIFFLTAKKDGSHIIHCIRNLKTKGERKFFDVKCVRYYKLEPLFIIKAEKSNEVFPPPKRDLKEEIDVLTKTALQPRFNTEIVLGEFEGKIVKTNVKSPVKTIEVENKNKHSPVRRLIVIIDPSTKIFKMLKGSDQLIVLSPKDLTVGRKVSVVYSSFKEQNVAQFITVKE